MSQRDNGTAGTPEVWDVAIVGGGLSGLTTAIFTARAELDTLVLNTGASIVKRNAHLENFPGFPAGVNPRLLVEMIEDQAERNGATLQDAKVTELRRRDGGGGFVLGTDGDEVLAENVVVASWSDLVVLEVVVDVLVGGSMRDLLTDEAGRTSVEGLYAAGRIADQYHQAIVNAGHGATTAISLIEDVDPDFYHDWVAPEGYFTLRDREVPKGCEEIPREERNRRERESVRVMQAYFEEPRDAPPVPHPSLAEKDAFDP